MDDERLRWITKTPTLDRWTIDVTLSNTPEGRMALVTAAGYCNRKRGTLWTSSELLPADRGGYTPVDHVTHLTLVCLAERPRTQAQFDRSMVGGSTGNEDPTLF